MIFDDLLSPRALKVWNDYVEGASERSRKVSLGILRRFLSTIRGIDPNLRHEFALRLCRFTVDDKINIPIRDPLFIEVIFPELMTLYEEDAGSAARYLASFYHFVLKSEKMMTLLEDEGLTQIELLKLATTHNPEDTESAEQLLSLWEQWFDYCVAEAPDVIRFKGEPVTLEEKKYLLDELKNFEQVMSRLNEKTRFESSLKSWQKLISEWEPD